MKQNITLSPALYLSRIFLSFFIFFALPLRMYAGPAETAKGIVKFFHGVGNFLRSPFVAIQAATEGKDVDTFMKKYLKEQIGIKTLSGLGAVGIPGISQVAAGGAAELSGKSFQSGALASVGQLEGIVPLSLAIQPATKTLITGKGFREEFMKGIRSEGHSLQELAIEIPQMTSAALTTPLQFSGALWSKAAQEAHGIKGIQEPLAFMAGLQKGGERIAKMTAIAGTAQFSTGLDIAGGVVKDEFKHIDQIGRGLKQYGQDLEKGFKEGAEKARAAWESADAKDQVLGWIALAPPGAEEFASGVIEKHAKGVGALGGTITGDKELEKRVAERTRIGIQGSIAIANVLAMALPFPVPPIPGAGACDILGTLLMSGIGKATGKSEIEAVADECLTPQECPANPSEPPLSVRLMRVTVLAGKLQESPTDATMGLSKLLCSIHENMPYVIEQSFWDRLIRENKLFKITAQSSPIAASLISKSPAEMLTRQESNPLLAATPTQLLTPATQQSLKGASSKQSFSLILMIENPEDPHGELVPLFLPFVEESTRKTDIDAFAAGLKNFIYDPSRRTMQVTQSSDNQTLGAENIVIKKIYCFNSQNSVLAPDPTCSLVSKSEIPEDAFCPEDDLGEKFSVDFGDGITRWTTGQLLCNIALHEGKSFNKSFWQTLIDKKQIYSFAPKKVSMSFSHESFLPGFMPQQVKKKVVVFIEDQDGQLSSLPEAFREQSIARFLYNPEDRQFELTQQDNAIISGSIDIKKIFCFEKKAEVLVADPLCTSIDEIILDPILLVDFNDNLGKQRFETASLKEHFRTMTPAYRPITSQTWMSKVPQQYVLFLKPKDNQEVFFIVHDQDDEVSIVPDLIVPDASKKITGAHSLTYNPAQGMISIKQKTNAVLEAHLGIIKHLYCLVKKDDGSFIFDPHCRTTSASLIKIQQENSSNNQGEVIP